NGAMARDSYYIGVAGISCPKKKFRRASLERRKCRRLRCAAIASVEAWSAHHMRRSRMRGNNSLPSDIGIKANIDSQRVQLPSQIQKVKAYRGGYGNGVCLSVPS